MRSNPTERGLSRLKRWLVGRHPRRTLWRGLVLALLCAVVVRFVWRPAWTHGISMEPTIHDGRFHFINLLAYRRAAPKRGDIVAIRGPGQRVMFLKRVLGLPGEQVVFLGGQLLVDGDPVHEPYTSTTGNWQMDAQVLQTDEYFVAGDNRSMARQDHLHGVVSRHDIVGRFGP